MKKIITLAVAICMIISSSIFANATVGGAFSDVSESHWAHNNVINMAKEGIVAGYPDGTFKPEKTVTYGEFIKMAVVATSGKDPGPATGAVHWASKYYQEAVDLGMFSSSDIKVGNLGYNIPRSDMALITANALTDTVDPADAQIIKDYIIDSGSFGNRSAAIIKSYRLGILAGYSDRSFGPKKGLTRAEAAAVINRLTNEDARVKVDLAAMQKVISSTAGTLPNGANISKDVLVSTINKTFPVPNNYMGEAVDGSILKYSSDIVYMLDPAAFFDGELFQISYDSNSWAAIDTDTQKAIVKCFLQAYTGDQWDEIYADFIAATKKTSTNYSKYYNGREVWFAAYSDGVGMTVYK